MVVCCFLGLLFVFHRKSVVISVVKRDVCTAADQFAWYIAGVERTYTEDSTAQ